MPNISANPVGRVKINHNHLRTSASRKLEDLQEISGSFSSMIRCAHRVASKVHHQVKIKPIKVGPSPWGFRIDGVYLQGPLSYATERFIAGEDDGAVLRKALSLHQISFMFREVDEQIVIKANPREIEDKHRLAAIKKLKVKERRLWKMIEDLGPIGTGVLVESNHTDVPLYYQAPVTWKRTVTYYENFTDPYDEIGIPGKVVETKVLPIPLSSAYFSNHPKAVYLREKYDEVMLEQGRIVMARLPLYTLQGAKKVRERKRCVFKATNIKLMTFSERDEFVTALHERFFQLFSNLRTKTSASSIPPGMMEHAIYINDLGGDVTVSRNQKVWMMTYGLKESLPDSESEARWPPRSAAIAYLDQWSESRTESEFVESTLRGKRIGYYVFGDIDKKSR